MKAICKGDHRLEGLHCSNCEKGTERAASPRALLASSKEKYVRRLVKLARCNIPSLRQLHIGGKFRIDSSSSISVFERRSPERPLTPFLGTISLQ